MLVYGPPWPTLLAFDDIDHFIKVPLVAKGDAAGADLFGNLLAPLSDHRRTFHR